MHFETIFMLLQDHCLVDLLHQWQDGRLPVEITCVIRLGRTYISLVFSILWVKGYHVL